MKRQPIPSSLRFDVWRRDGFTCTYCGKSAFTPGVVLEVDHIIAVASGGSDEMGNLTTCCPRCNQRKAMAERPTGIFNPPADYVAPRWAGQRYRRVFKRADMEPARREARTLMRILAQRGPEYFTLNQASDLLRDEHPASWAMSHKVAEYLRDRGFFDLAWQQNSRTQWWQLSEQAIRWLNWTGFDWTQRQSEAAS